MAVQPLPKKTSVMNYRAAPGEAAYATPRELKVESVQTLARKLIQQATDCQAACQTDATLESDQEIILDLEIDGFRCLLLRLLPKQAPPLEPAPLLSPRELEIARMIAKGYPNKTIAAVLEISAWTVCTHIRRVFAKLNVGSRAAMVARLVEEGTLSEKNNDDRKTALAQLFTQPH
jgi:DNA-binding CsgD family transcriptional regulator